MNYEQSASQARGQMGEWCKACPVCNGKACGNKIPGPGAKGLGEVASRNYQAWQQRYLVMDTIHDEFTASCETTVLGRSLSVPVMIGPVGDVNRHYSDKYNTVTYNSAILRAADDAGTLAWTGDGLDATIMTRALTLIEELGGRGVPTIKPWSMDVVDEKLDAALAARPAAIAMDIDAAGLPFLRGQQPPAGAKTVAQLAKIAQRCHDAGIPFVLKGIMSVSGARKAAEAKADAIVVSNHGGRVLDGVPATADVLPQIASEVQGSLQILVDGGIRNGTDVFRALALGANAVLICRPFVVVAFGAGEEGIRGYLDQLAAELTDCMEMCGAKTVQDITREMVV